MSGTVAVDDDGNVTGGGIALALYTAIEAQQTAARPLPDPNVPDDDWDDGAASWRAAMLDIVVKTRRAWAREALAHASVLAASAGRYTWSPASQGEVWAAGKAGSRTVGMAWGFLLPGDVKGVRVFCGTAGDVKVRIYNATDAVLEYSETFTAVSGAASLLFAAPFTPDRTKVYIVSAWDTGGAVYLAWDASTSALAGNSPGSFPLLVGDRAVIRGSYYAVGDANPTLVNASEYAAVEPIL
jgi:hypothetical protein